MSERSNFGQEKPQIYWWLSTPDDLLRSLLAALCTFAGWGVVFCSAHSKVSSELRRLNGETAIRGV
jgi:hypothetical protein